MYVARTEALVMWLFTRLLFIGGQKEDERELLQNFDKIIEVFLSLKEKCEIKWFPHFYCRTDCIVPNRYQRVISDICKRMGAGMAEFVVKASIWRMA